MKIKPIYIYLAVFIIFVAAVIFFSNTTKDSTKTIDVNPNAQVPNDDIHRGMPSKENGEMPSKSNVMQEAIDKMNALKAEVDKNPGDTLKARQYAEMLVAHDPDQALKLYEKILKTGPKRVDIMLELTFLYFNRGEINKAEEFNNQVLKIDKKNLLAMYNTGGLAQAKGDTKRAKEIWQGIAKNYPSTQIGHIAGELVKQLDQTPKK